MTPDASDFASTVMIATMAMIAVAVITTPPYCSKNSFMPFPPFTAYRISVRFYIEKKNPGSSVSVWLPEFFFFSDSNITYLLTRFYVPLRYPFSLPLFHMRIEKESLSSILI